MLTHLMDLPSLTFFSLVLSSSFSVSLLLSLIFTLLFFFIFRLPPSPSMLHWAGIVMGHRGCRTNLNIPENSLAAFAYAFEHGAKAIEMDISLTSDGVIVCMHDGGVERTCEGVGEVNEMTFRQVNSLKFRKTGKRAKEYEPVEPEIEKRKRWNAPTSRTSSPARSSSPSQPEEEEECGEEWKPSIPYPSNLLNESLTGPPSLENVIRFAQSHGLKMMIEIKEYRRPHALFDKLLKLFEQYPYLYFHAYIATFNPYHLYCIRSLSLDLPTCLLYCRDCLEWYHLDKSKEMQLPAVLNHRPVRWVLDQLLLYSMPLITVFLRPSAVGPHNVLMSIETCEWMRKRGVMMDVWCVNRRHELELWREEGAIVTTDFCFPLRNERGEKEEGRDGAVDWRKQVLKTPARKGWWQAMKEEKEEEKNGGFSAKTKVKLSVKTEEDD